MNSRANCKLALNQKTSVKPLMVIKQGNQSKPITDKMIGEMLQKLMAA